MHPSFSDQMVNDHIQDLRDQAVRQRLSRRERARSNEEGSDQSAKAGRPRWNRRKRISFSARERAGLALLNLGERLIADRSREVPAGR